jgi:YVTN family beta-propeller protein
MPSPFCPDPPGVVARDFLSDPFRRAHRSPLNRSLIAFSATLLLAATSVVRADNGVGAWDPPASWPIIAIHGVLMPDGRVMTYGTTETGQQTGFTVYDIWDPASGFGTVAHATVPNTTGTDLFCSSQLLLPDTGNVFIAGGDNFVNGATTNTGNNNSNVYTLATSTLARGNNMNRARWYSSSTTLLNGETYIQGGTSGGDRPEVRGTDGVFRLLSSASTSGYAETFPRNFLAPDGRVFGFDNAGRMYYVVPTGTGTITTVGQVGQLPGATSWTSSAAMFRPGRILQMGGASSAALVIDINGPTPVVTSTQSMSSQRQWVSATVLPDGRVLATGGSAVDNALTNVNNSAEVWDSNGNGGTGKWTVGPSGVNARLYHSGALLLPDARVMIMGGGAPGPLVNKNIEMYTPSYLLDALGGPMPRPSIAIDAPTTVQVGQSFSFGYSSASPISRVTLVKTGSVTHSVNMDQRFVELGFQTNGAVLDVNGPVRATDTPPGYYLLFILSSQGVPSVGKIVRIGVASNPNPTPDTTQVIGGTGGTPFTLACNANEVLAGIYGTSAGTYVNQAGLQCVQIDQNGRWIGTPVNRGITGVASGVSYTKTCPANYAISGYKGRSSQYVDQLDFECRALTSQGKITGIGQFLGAVGGSGGTAQGPYNCGTNNPAYALTGRSGSWLDNFGMQCRQATLTTVNSPPTIVNPGTLTGTVGVPVDITIGASDPDGQPITFAASGLPTGLSINTSSGRITGTPSAPGSFIVTITVSDPTSSSNAGFTWNINPSAPFVLNPLSPATPTLAGSVATYTASSSNGVNARYSWYFDDGSAQTAYSSSPSITHTFATPGVYYVTVTAIDDFTAAQTQTVAQTIYLAATANRPANSSTIAYEQRSGSNSRVWVVNQDNDSVSAFDAVTNGKLAELTVGTAPRGIARAPDGLLWVTNKLSANISVINPNTLSVAQTITLPFASQPYGVAFAPTGSFAFVVLEGLGRVLKLDATTGAQLGSANVGPNPRHLAVSGDGATLLVSRFITPHLPGEETATVQTQNGAVQYGGEVVRVSTASMTVAGTTVLRHSDAVDLENSGSGVPNYLGAPVISPDGTAAWVPSKQDNIKRGMLRNQLNLNFQNTVRAISSRIDLSTNTEDFASRLDHDNASVASAVAFDKYGVYMFVALETSREVEVVDAHGRWEIFRFNVGSAPQGLAVSPDGLKLYVNNFMDRTVGVFDLSRLVNLGETNVPALATLSAVTNEKLSTQVLKGKQFFYDALDPRLARDRYLSCASCHNDGGQDGRVWDLTGFGEGLRNTVNLRGRAGAQGQGFLHWSGNFDEVQDFEGQIRNLSGGNGLMTNTDFNTGTRNQPLGDLKAGISADLDALAAYVTSLNTFTSSPLRNSDGTLTTDAQAGKQLFRDMNCAQCHSGTAFTESGAATLRDIGTIKPSSGQRLGGPLTGIDTPTLRDVWATAPYFHDGSAATLGDAVSRHNGVSITGSDLTKLVAYLQQIGSDEASAPVPANGPPTVTNPGPQNNVVSVAVDLAITASDPNGDPLTYSATGLPNGLSINANTGHITGTPNTVNVYAVTVTATDDGLLSGSTSFNWTITDVTAPTTPTNLTTTAISTTQINLSWNASTDNVGVTGYQIERCVGAGCSNFTALTTVTTTSYSNTGLTSATSYSYRVRAKDAAGNLSGFSKARAERTLRR